MSTEVTKSYLQEIVQQQKNGKAAGIYSVCSAHPLVLEAALEQAAADGTHLLIEATSNQVDQFGGYTGMTPTDFRNFVEDLANGCGFPLEKLILGGDHLGPNRWQGEPADTAMEKAEALVDAYVAAGYTKIHLDCSMSCAGDPTPLTDQIVAERAARLAKVAEARAEKVGLKGKISYVIGTEVPVPGGAHETLGKLTPTSPTAAKETIAAHQSAFDAVGLGYLWPQIVAIVVQPAVEFDHVQVIDYVSAATEQLREVLNDQPTLIFEAHSTDYQLPENLRHLVEDHWAILKVGPGLTFALREAILALAQIEKEVVSDAEQSHIVDVIDRVMTTKPQYWEPYYMGTDQEKRLARFFSYSDRIRYYLPDEEINRAVAKMVENLDAAGIPQPLLSQYLPEQYWRVRRTELENNAVALMIDKVRDALRPYANACR